MDRKHVRVRADADVMTAYCTICNSQAPLPMPMNAGDFTALLNAFLRQHEDCAEDAR